MKLDRKISSGLLAQLGQIRLLTEAEGHDLRSVRAGSSAGSSRRPPQVPPPAGLQLAA